VINETYLRQKEDIDALSKVLRLNTEALDTISAALEALCSEVANMRETIDKLGRVI
jgi:phage host-nuclease inhibitor protein Gam